MKCSLCGSEKIRNLCQTRDYNHHLSERTFSVCRCTDCGLIFTLPVLEGEEIRKCYPEGYYNARFSSFERRYSEFIQSRTIRKIIRQKKGTTLLDIGCGSGEFLEKMKKAGWEVYGMDVSAEACNLAREKIQKNVFNDTLKDISFPDNFFDVITLWHVFEHISDPDGLLKEISRILKPDGMLIMEVPHIDNPVFKLTMGTYFALDAPRHIYHYSAATLKQILEKNGYTITQTYYPILGSPLNLFKSVWNKLLYEFQIPRTRSNLIFFLGLPLIALALITYKIFSFILPWGETIQVFCKKRT